MSSDWREVMWSPVEMNAQTPKRIYEVLGLLVVGKGEEKTRMESRTEANIHLLYIFFSGCI